MGLAVTFKWRGWSLLSLSLVVLIANLAGGIKSSLCSVSTFQKVRLSRVQTRPSSKYEVSPHLCPAS